MAIDDLTYPQPVLDRSGPPVGGGGAVAVAAPAPPRTRVIAFTTTVNANARTTSSSERLAGPSLIRSLVWTKGGTPQGVMGVQLGKSPVAVTETNVSPSVALPYTRLFDGVADPGGAGHVPNFALSESDFQGNIISPNAALGIVVLDSEWFLCVSAVQGAAVGAKVLAGYVVVLEGVSLEALRSFL